MSKQPEIFHKSMRCLPLLFCWMCASHCALSRALAADISADGERGFKGFDLKVPNLGKPGFTLLTPEQTGIAFTNTLSELASAENRILNNGSGLAAGDFDNDGWVDLFVC